ncbi:aldehyde dehydrogenase (NADP(+)) [Sphingosinithalassobacter sp. LHW66-3]|uniref:aldehyde dehydrogenase (NADP(+)) n=1 Tax=Sphingosinithalassobacter sp. LHW66-3 TaxID=3424718 RepID=UPI003D6AA576
MELTGELFIGQTRVSTGDGFNAIDPSSGERIEPRFSAAGTDELERACALAEAAFPTYSTTAIEQRAAFLESAADNIMALGDALIERAHLETALPVARLTGERARTANQLKLFAAELRDGGWLGVRIDPAMPDRQPLPRPDLRQRKVPLGPVAVFGASNFPLAFSVAGGDTASALAAGCPVVVKGHPAHPGTSEMVAGAIAKAVKDAGLPEGVFSLLSGPSHELGSALVADPRIKAVGFTGSRGGGVALMKVAADRPVPIPVYAEMSAINPVILMQHALEQDAERLGKEYAGSLTMGVGQFCTNPGIVLAIDTPALDRFVKAAAAAVCDAPAGTMLTTGIADAFRNGVAKLAAKAGVTSVAQGIAGEGPSSGQAALFTVDADAFTSDPELAEEVFGAASVLVRCADADALARAIAGLEGQLTGTVHFVAADEPEVAKILPALESRVGRLIANGWPTGVEVSHAMVHGGPFPATSDGRSTSVGTLAIDRFLRPVCYQDFPDTLLPDVLRRDADAGIPRRVDGKLKI